jgi:hypothetical protein
VPPRTARKPARYARQPRFLARINNHPYQKRGYGEKQAQRGVVFIQDRRLRTDGLSSAHVLVMAENKNGLQELQAP